MVFSKALHEEPDVSGIICSSLEILVQQNDNILKGKVDLSDTEISVPKGRAIARYSQQVAECNLKALSLSSHKLLPVLYDVFLESSKDTGGFLQVCLDGPVPNVELLG